MVASIGAVASPSQGASYYERDGYYARDDPEHRAASAWAGQGAAELGLEGPVDPDIFKAVLEGAVPDGSGRRLGKDGEIHHRPGRDSGARLVREKRRRDPDAGPRDRADDPRGRSESGHIHVPP